MVISIDYPTTLEHLNIWLDVCAGQPDEMKEKLLENLILKARDGKAFTISGPDKQTYYYVRIPCSNKKIRKKTRLEVLKEMYLFYYGKGYKEPQKGFTFADMWQEWYEHEEAKTKCNNIKMRKAPATLKHYQNDYKRFFEGSPIEKLRVDKTNEGELECTLAAIFLGENEKRIKNVIGYIDNAFKLAYKNRRIKENVFCFVDKDALLSVAIVPKPKADEEQILTEDQKQTFAEYVYKRERETPDYMPSYAMELSLLTGMRIGEIVALKWCCIDDKWIHVDFAERRDDFTGSRIIVEPKNRKHRKIPMSTDLKSLFSRIKALHHENAEGFIFCDEDGKRYVESVIGNAVRRFGMASLGIKSVSIHRLRRTKASELNANGVPMMTSCAMLGHSPQVEAEHYLFNTKSHEEMIDALEKTAPRRMNIVPFQKAI